MDIWFISHILAIMNNSAMNIYFELSVDVCFNLS